MGNYTILNVFYLPFVNFTTERLFTETLEKSPSVVRLSLKFIDYFTTEGLFSDVSIKSPSVVRFIRKTVLARRAKF